MCISIHYQFESLDTLIDVDLDNEIHPEDVSDDLLEQADNAGSSLVWEDADTERHAMRRGKKKGRKGKRRNEKESNRNDELSTSMPSLSTALYAEHVTKVRNDLSAIEAALAFLDLPQNVFFFDKKFLICHFAHFPVRPTTMYQRHNGTSLL